MAGVAGLAAVPLVAATTTVAQEPVPQPSSCAGLAAPDWAQDQRIWITAPFGPYPVSTDITGVFFRYAKDSSGDYVLTANIRVRNLDKEEFDEAGTGHEWRVEYRDPDLPPAPADPADDDIDATRVAGARIDRAGQVQFYEDSAYTVTLHELPKPPGLPPAARTEGDLHEGPGGVIEIEIPASRGFAGKTLTDVRAISYLNTVPIDRDDPVADESDRAPDGDAFGTPYTVEPCPADEGESGGLPTVSVGSASVTEGNAGTTTLSAPVTLSAPSAQAVTVKFATSDGTATKPGDYAESTGTVTIPAGQTTGTASVQVNGDTTDEPDETLTVTLSEPTNATLATVSAAQTITDDDGPAAATPAISIADATAAEGDSGATDAAFAVTLTAASSQAVTVRYATADGSAKQPDDYATTSGTLTFPPGQTTRTIAVPVKGDTTPEADETFTIALSAPANATLADASATGTITDDDDAPAAPPSAGPANAPTPPAATAPASPPPAATRALQLKVTPKVVRARRARRNRVVRLRVTSREPLQAVSAALTKGKRSVGRSRLRRLSKRGVLRLKLTRSLSKGAYSLTLTANRSDGSRGSQTVTLRVR